MTDDKLDIDFVDKRISESLSFLEKHFTQTQNFSSEPLFRSALEVLRTNALGGKHLRPRLVHIAAGDVSGDQRTTAVIFGGAVELLHAALLVHDDLIDDDPYRRGKPTLHEQIATASGNRNVGMSAAILAGDMGLLAMFQALSSSELADAMVRKACAMMAGFSLQTVYGEMLDVSHRIAYGGGSGAIRVADVAETNSAASFDTVRASNFFKTSLYTFTAPLHLGALAAGRDDPDTLDALSAVADPLGQAYQAADDIAGAVAPMEDTGKVTGGDLAQGRRTVLTMRLHTMSLPEAVKAVADEAYDHIADARQAVQSPALTPVTRAGLDNVITRVERSVRTYV